MKRGNDYWADLVPRSGSDRAKLTKRVGALPSESLREVERGLRVALDLD